MEIGAKTRMKLLNSCKPTLRSYSEKKMLLSSYLAYSEINAASLPPLALGIK